MHIIEIWIDIIGYEGLYQVSNLGRIKYLTKPRISPTGGVGIRGEGCMKGSDNQRGYLQVVLHKNNVPCGFKIHRLVAEAFLPNPNKYPQVNHKDEIKTNNNVTNLEWCTPKYNANYGTKNSRISKKLTDNSFTTKKVFQYTKDGVLIKEWVSASNCSRYGYSRECVRDCCLGKQKTHKGYIWKYMEDN